MRATLDIDDDVLFAVKAPAAVEEKSAGKALSDLARQALQGQPTESSEVRNGFPLLRGSKAFVTPSQVDQLLEDELGECGFFLTRMYRSRCSIRGTSITTERAFGRRTTVCRLGEPRPSTRQGTAVGQMKRLTTGGSRQ